MKYIFEECADYCAYQWRSLTLAFDRAALKTGMFFDDLYWRFADPLAERFERLERQVKGVEEDGSIKLEDGVYLYLPEPSYELSAAEKQKEKFRQARDQAIDAEFTDIPAPAPRPHPSDAAKPL